MKTLTHFFCDSTCNALLKRCRWGLSLKYIPVPQLYRWQVLFGQWENEKWKLQEAHLGCNFCIYPSNTADADPQGGIKQPEDVTSRHGSCNSHSYRTRLQPDRWPPRPPGSSRLLVQRACSCLAPFPGGLGCCRPQWDFSLACHSYWSWTSSQNRR